MADIPLPATEQAVQNAAALVQQAWITAAENLPLSAQLRLAYLKGLHDVRSLVYPYNGDRLQAVVQNVAPEAPSVEFGQPRLHLPSVIKWAQSPAARRGKNGYYLIVPFRHAAPRARQPVQSLTWAMYRIAKQLQPRQYLTAGESRGLAVHAPGLTPYKPAYPLNVRPGYQHAAMQERLQRTSERRRGYSSFMTFRTLSEHSTGWWIPARNGLQIHQQVERQTAPLVREMIEQAIVADLTRALQEQWEARRP